MNPKSSVIISAGGTGGHIYPALALAKELQQQQIHVIWLGTTQGLESRIVPAEGILLKTVSVEGVRGRGLLSLLKAPFLILKAILDCLLIYRKVKPEAVCGFGGYVTGPACVAARILGVKVVIHEQNAIAGTTNRLLARIADKVFTAFPNTFEQGHYVGNPIRRELLEIETPEQRYQGKKETFNILVLGGSRGAKSINDMLPVIIAGLKSKDVALRHQCGKGKLANLLTEYSHLDINADVSEYIDDMAEAYRWADLIICRAGASTVLEIGAVGIPSILIPFPYAIDDHQTKNAEALKSVDGAYIFQEKTMNVDEIINVVDEIAQSKEKKMAMASAARTLRKTRATKVMAEYCLESI